MEPGVLDVIWFCVGGTRDDSGLVLPMPQLELADFRCCLVTIHDWHAAVHENQGVSYFAIAVCISEGVVRLKTVRNLVNEGANGGLWLVFVLVDQMGSLGSQAFLPNLFEQLLLGLLQHDFEAHQIVGLVVDYQNARLHILRHNDFEPTLEVKLVSLVMRLKTNFMTFPTSFAFLHLKYVIFAAYTRSLVDGLVLKAGDAA